MGIFLVSCLILVFFTTCQDQGSPKDIIRSLSQKEEPGSNSHDPVLGSGYDSLTDEIKNRCMKRKKPLTLEFVERKEFTIRVPENYESLESALDLQPLSIFQFNRNSLQSTRSGVVAAARLHDYHHFVLISKKTADTEWLLEGTSVKEKYLDYYDRNGQEGFKNRCGDQYLQRFLMGRESHLLLDIKSVSQQEQQVLQTALYSYTGDYRREEDFHASANALLAFNIASLTYIAGNGPAETFPQPEPQTISRVKERFRNESKGKAYPHSLQFAPYLIPTEEGEAFFQNRGKIRKELLASKNLYYDLLNFQANLDYIKQHAGEFPGSDPTEMDEYDDIIATALTRIQLNVNRCSSDRPGCLLSPLPAHQLMAVRLPERQSTGKIHTSLSLCDSPVYRQGSGAPCGVARYRSRKSPFCGVELYKKIPDKLCPGYLPPLGPKVLKELPAGFSASQPENDTRRARLDLACREKFGEDWIFSSVSSDQQQPHHPPQAPEGKHFINCVRLAKIASCRHPSHGAETYRECQHENHGIESYRQCRSPAFGIEFFRPVACGTPQDPEA